MTTLGDAVVPALNVEQMREVDRAMVEDLHRADPDDGNAGRSLAHLAIARFAPSSVTVLAGPGVNGGGGLVAARHLINRGRPFRWSCPSPIP
jgi:NAD(P)H-hydrate epimerase